MTSTSATTTGTVRGMSEAAKIHAWITRWLVQSDPSNAPNRPLLIGISGPQGSGKTTLTRNLVSLLSSTPRPGPDDSCTGQPLGALAISLDDFYKTHAELVALESLHPNNKLLHGRGLPGTHDLALLLSTLDRLHSRDPAAYPVHVPVYDKAAHNGQGDRSSTEQQVVTCPPDVILLEGWMLGFTPPAAASDLETLVSPDLLAKYGLANLAYVATHELAAYAAIDAKLDHFIHWTPADVAIVYTWRVQQEQELRSRNGGVGMNDALVRRFVDRYMPLYQACVPKLMAARLWGKSNRKVGSVHLRVRVSDAREVVAVEEVNE